MLNHPKPIAFVRTPSSAIQNCELTHMERVEIDLNRALSQHAEYEFCLESNGYEVRKLPYLADAADAVFVEDTAVNLDEIIVMCRPGAVSRLVEVESATVTFKKLKPLRAIQAPGTLDGGDVLRIGKKIFVGVGARSNQNGFEQLRAIGEEFGYQVIALTTKNCLHLKTAVTQIGPKTVLLNPAWIDPNNFSDFQIIEIDSSEPFSANALLLGEDVVLSKSAFLTIAKVKAAGFKVLTVDNSELAKAEAGLTCCSVLIH